MKASIFDCSLFDGCAVNSQVIINTRPVNYKKDLSVCNLILSLFTGKTNFRIFHKKGRYLFIFTQTFKKISKKKMKIRRMKHHVS